MQRHGGSGQPGKAQRTDRAKVRKAPKAHLSTDHSPEQFDQLKRERDEALERETATSDILRIISNSPTNLQSALGAIAESAARLLDVAGAEISRVESDGLRLMAKHGALPQRPVGSIRPINRGWVMGRAVIDRTTVQVPNLQTAASEFPEGAASARQYGHRTTLATPLLREGIAIGAILIRRMEVRPFTDRQIALLQNFAAQAVIAIENARLLNDLRQRTDDLSESLEQQTATSEVLKVISSSTGKLQPVFQTMLENAVRICGAKFGNLFLKEGDGLRATAFHDAPQAYVEERRRNPVIHPNPATVLGQAITTKQPAQVADIQDYEPDKIDADSGTTGVRFAKLTGARTVLAVPMVKESELVGVVVIYRQEVRPFTDKQIELVQNFAAQAVIAIENTRLLSELRESLQQQTATADVLKVISSSPGELDPVFEAMLEKAVRICDANFGMLFRIENDAVSAAAMFGVPPKFAEFWHRGPQRLGRGTALSRVVETRQTVHIADVKLEPAYVKGEPLFLAAVSLGGFRTLIVVPMLRDNELVGAIGIYRQEVRPFTDKQIELLQNFASQAVIAIENTRLLNELRESLQQQTAPADVLKVISSSPGELMPVFQAMLAKATHLCEASYGGMWLCEGGAFRAVSHHGDLPAEFVERWRSGTLFQPSPNLPMVRAIKTRRPIQITDLRATEAYREGYPMAVVGVDVAGIRSMVAVPMFKENEPIGVMSIYRKEVRPFTDKHIELVTNFAAQAVIAIENTRLLG